MKFLFLLIFLRLAMAQSNTAGNFTVIAPYDIRRGKPFNVVVKGFDIKGTVNITLRILGTTDTGSQLNIKRLTNILPKKTKTLVQFSTSKIPQGSYNFSVSSWNYSESKPLVYKSKECAFLVQTDKPIYFPNDIIRFRVFAVNSETRSLNPKQPPTVLIRDGSGSVVLNISNIGFVKGKYQGELRLISNPPLGLWKIEAVSGESTGGKFIEVATCAFPLVYSVLTVPAKVPISDNFIQITIVTKESYKGLIDGDALVVFKKSGTEVYRKELIIKCNTTRENITIFPVNFKDLSTSSAGISSYDVRLEYYDQLTNTTVTDLASFEVIPKAYQIILSGDAYLKPGSDFNYQIVVVKYDGSSGPAGMSINVNVEALQVTQTVELDDNGSATSSFNVPVGTSSVSIEAIADNAISATLNVTLPLPLPGTVSKKLQSSLRLDIITKSPTVNEDVKVEVTTNEAINFITCLLVAKGVLLETIEVPISFDSNQMFQVTTFTFKPSLLYVPITNIIGYYVRSDGRIVTASISVEITKEFGNYFSYSFEKMDIGTGEQVEFDITSYLKSVVSISAVNQRLLPLRDTVSLTKDEIFGSLLNFYGSASSTSLGRLPDYEFRLNYYGLLVFTNIKPYKKSFQYKKGNLLNQLNQSSKMNQMPSPVKLGSPRVIKALSPFAGSIFWKNIVTNNLVSDDDSGKKGYGTALDTTGKYIANYTFYGVSMSAYYGIGLPVLRPSITTFIPFYMTAKFPSSIKVSEILVQGVTFYNHLAKDHTFEVTINKDPHYEMVPSPQWKDAGNVYTRIVNTKSDELIQQFQFKLRALSVGRISLLIYASSNEASDSIMQDIEVRTIGVFKNITDTRIIRFTEHKLKVSDTLKCNYPPTFLSSYSVNLTLYGDIMSRPIMNLPTGLIGFPGGCGEQTLLYLVPDIVAWNYLMETKQMTPRYHATLYDYISKGYQNELLYLRTDGGFSAGGNTNPFGSTWLTAYAGWAFYLARDIISIDMNILRNGLNFLATKYQLDGSFVEQQPIFHTEMDGDIKHDITLTAYVTIYITTVLDDFPEYKEMQKKSVAYLENNWHQKNDVFGLAIIAYALKLAGSPRVDNIMNIFYARRKETATEIKFETIEATAYCLLLLLVKGEKLHDAEKIANYLLRVSNTFGGYYYSQDTVLGVYALGQYAVFTQPIKEVDLTIVPNIGRNIQKKIDFSNKSDNPEVHPNTTSIDLLAKSVETGHFVASITCSYYEESTSYQSPFEIAYGDTYVCKDEFSLTFSLSFNPIGKSTDMTTVEVTLPSGFVFNKDSKNPTAPNPAITKNGVILTYERITNIPTVVKVRATKVNDVDGIMSGYVEVIDYYNRTNQALSTYSLPDLPNNCNMISRRR